MYTIKNVTYRKLELQLLAIKLKFLKILKIYHFSIIKKCIILYICICLYYISYIFLIIKALIHVIKHLTTNKKKVIWILYKSKYFNLLWNYNNKDWIDWKIDNLQHSVRVKYSKNNSLESKLIIIYTYNCI